MALTITSVARHQPAKARRATGGRAAQPHAASLHPTPSASLIRIGPGTDLRVGVIGGPTRFVW